MPVPVARRPRWLLPAVAAGVLVSASLLGWRLAGVGAAVAGAPQAAAAAAAVAPVAPAAPVAEAAAFGGFRGSVVRFASVAEGRTALGADDTWVRATGSLQRALLMGVPAGHGDAAGRDAFRAFQSAAVLAWTPERRQRFARALEAVAPRFNALGITLPPEVLLVSSSGRESDETPHTRGAAVVFPIGHDPQPYTDVELVAHELWHVVSRYQAGLRTRLYATLGFSPAAPLEWPAAWASLREANPDAPHHEHLMWVTLAGRPVALMPVVVVVAGGAAAPGQAGLVEPQSQTRLIEVIPGSGGQPTRAVLSKGVPVWHAPAAVPEYLKNLGGNSDYIVHPEETLAENIMFLVSGRPVPNPQLLQRIAGVLAGR